LRSDRYKLLLFADEGRFEMVDLARDPLELNNVFAIEGHLWTDWQAELRALAGAEPMPSRERIEQAAALRGRVLGR
jgi:hypothetical protein